MSITLSFPLLAQAFVSGIMLGGVFALIAIGLTLIWGVMGIINFAHGEFLMVGMYIAYFLAARTGLDPYFTILVTVPALFLIGAGIFRVNIQPVLKDPVMNQILLTVGLMLVLQNLALVLFTATPLSLDNPYNKMIFNVGPVVIPLSNLLGFVGSLLGVAILWWFLRYTDMGRAIRAASQNREAATLVGIDVRRTYLVAFGIGSACVGLAASLMIPFYYVAPLVGAFLGLVAFIVVILGGMGNVLGALVGGLIIGLTETMGAAILPGSLSRVLTFAIFILVLLFRPQGIFGRRQA
ncbi:MAG: branched-chain amino acid ABC transporter permease [Chloroflexi bacterium]|nr:MAG: branched-chain amino acid ABC transporter permease [Chloroflexota bacterium]